MKKPIQSDKELTGAVGRGEWKSVPRLDLERKRYQRYAESTFRKDRRVNIRISDRDLLGIKKRALEEGVPYQTLIASLLHKYVAGRLVERTLAKRSS